MDERIGKVAYSKAGRDEGKMFVVINIVKNNFAILADGDLRKIENPKLKNLKHVNITNSVAEEVQACLSKGELPDNHVIRKNLKRLQEVQEGKKRDGKEVW